MKHQSRLQIIGCTLVYSAITCLPALADRCAYISKQQGITALSRLDIDQTIYKLCEPCGDENARSTLIQDLSLEKVDYQDYWQIMVNGEGIDLAYVFVDSRIENHIVNLAAIADCPAVKVSPILPPESILEFGILWVWGS